MTAQILNVVVVLVGVYIALALACSWLQEQLAALLKLRANTLAKGVADLLSRDADAFGRLASHPLVASASSEAKTQFPSYLEARNFTLAFWQTVGSASASASTAVAEGKAGFLNLVQQVNAWAPQTDEAKRVKQSAVALLNAAQGDYEKLLGATDTWFDAQMDRVSGWYKRTAQYWLLAFAVVLAYGTGLDTIDLGRQLFAAPTIAAATAATVTSVADQHKDDKDPTAGIQAVASAIVDAQGLQDLRLFWWSPEPKTAPVKPDTLPVRIFGILLTAIAASLGAPFWFDVLKRVTNVRMAGIKPSGDTSK